MITVWLPCVCVLWDSDKLCHPYCPYLFFGGPGRSFTLGNTGHFRDNSFRLNMLTCDLVHLTCDLLTCDLLTCDLLTCDLLTCDLSTCDLLTCDLVHLTCDL